MLMFRSGHSSARPPKGKPANGAKKADAKPKAPAPGGEQLEYLHSIILCCLIVVQQIADACAIDKFVRSIRNRGAKETCVPCKGHAGRPHPP